MCIPPFPGEDINRHLLHVGFGCLSETLQQHGIEHIVVDMRVDYPLKELVRTIQRYRPDAICITCMTFKHDIVYDIIGKVKKRFPSLTVIIGGPHVSTIRAKVLEECKADLAVKLEGELTLLELCEGKPLKKIEGLIFREKGRVRENKDRPFIDLSTQPFPRYGKFDLSKYGGRIPIVTSRGCPYSCIYCPVHLSMGKQFRMRDAKSIFEELQFWVGKGKQEFEILDDNFTLFPKRVAELCSLIKKSGMDIYIALPNGVRVDKVDLKLLTLMRSAGFGQICFGVEAGNNKILRRIKKSATIEKVEEAIRNACKLGYDVELFFMVGHPDETPSDVEDSIRLALKYPVSDAKFYNILPFPNTELREWVTRNHYELYDLDKALNQMQHFGTTPLFSTPYFTKEEREKMILKARAASLLIKKRNLQRKMQKRLGYPGKLLASLFYTPLIYTSIRKFYGTELGKTAMNRGVRLLRVDVHHL